VTAAKLRALKRVKDITAAMAMPPMAMATISSTSVTPGNGRFYLPQKM